MLDVVAATARGVGAPRAALVVGCVWRDGRGAPRSRNSARVVDARAGSESQRAARALLGQLARRGRRALRRGQAPAGRGHGDALAAGGRTGAHSLALEDVQARVRARTVGRRPSSLPKRYILLRSGTRSSEGCLQCSAPGGRRRSSAPARKHLCVRSDVHWPPGV